MHKSFSRAHKESMKKKDKEANQKKLKEPTDEVQLSKVAPNEQKNSGSSGVASKKGSSRSK